MAAYQTDYLLQSDVASAGTVLVPYEKGTDANYYGGGVRIEYDSGGALSLSQASLTFSPNGFVILNSTGSTWRAGTLLRVSVDRRDYPITLANRSKGGAPTIILLGDSLTANNYVTASNNFTNYACEGSWNWANGISGNRFNVVGYKGTAGNTLADMIARFERDVTPIKSKYVRLIGGVNDLYTETASAQTTMARFDTLIQMIIDQGRIPILSTIWARTFSTAAVLRAHLTVNDYLRRMAYLNKDIKLWDGFAASVSPTDTSCGIRSGWTYDSSPAIHPSNVGAYYLGKVESVLLNSLEPGFPDFGGFEDYTNCDTSQGINLLDNVMFQGTGGTVSTGGTGTAPNGYTIQRASGTPTFSCAPVSLADATTGLGIGNYIQADITAGAANDEVQFLSANISTRGAAGATYQAEATITISGTPSNLNTVRFRARCDSGSSEAGWWGSNAQTVGNFPEGFTIRAVSAPITTLAAPVTMQWESRFKFSAAGSATVRVSKPRLRRIA